MEHENLIGKSFDLIYASETYRIEILDDAKLRWKRIKGDNAGQGDEEAYQYSRISETISLITWIEADGLGLSNVLCFSDTTLTTHANMGRDVFINPGTFAFVT